jgi:hypothetical protein
MPTNKLRVPSGGVARLIMSFYPKKNALVDPEKYPSH